MQRAFGRLLNISSRRSQYDARMQPEYMRRDEVAVMEDVKTVSARVTVTLEIQCPDNWGETYTVEQVHNQAKNGALGLLTRMIGREAGYSNRIKIIGTPKIEAIIVTVES